MGKPGRDDFVPETQFRPVGAIYGPDGPATAKLEVFGDWVNNSEGEMVFVGDIVNLHWRNPNNANALLTAIFRTSGQTQQLTLTHDTPDWVIVPIPQNYNARAESFGTRLTWETLPTIRT
jgi:hypothetical protein